MRGISFRRDGECVSTGPGEKLPREIDVPSPYLSGYFDNLLGLPWPALWETNRGCPYGCTFCDWGSSTLSKLRVFSADRVLGEIEFFGRAGLSVILCCDANFGILARDLELCEALVKAKERTGHPTGFASNYAKKSNERVFEIARRLEAAKMNFTGTTLSMQSNTETVLEAIKRGTIGSAKYRELKERYRQAELPTYTELILGLPTETKESWVGGLCDLMEDGHDDLRLYWLAVLPNAPINTPEELEKYGLQTMERGLIPGHDERCLYVNATKSMPFEDWIDGEVFATLFTRTLEAGGYTKFLGRFLKRARGVSYRSFYGRLFEDARTHPESVLGTLMALYADTVRTYATGDGIEKNIGDGALASGPEMRAFAERYPNIAPLQHTLLWLLMNEKIDTFYADLAKALTRLGLDPVTDPALCDVLRFSRDVMLTPDYVAETGKSCQYTHDWHRFFFGDGRLVGGPFQIKFTDVAVRSKFGVFPLKWKTPYEFAQLATGYQNFWDIHYRCHHQPEQMQVTALGSTVDLGATEGFAAERAVASCERERGLQLPVVSS